MQYYEKQSNDTEKQSLKLRFSYNLESFKITEMNISNKIRELQKSNNISQKELTEKIGFSVSAFNTALKRNDFKVSMLEKIANVFDVPLSSFFEGQDSENDTELLLLLKKMASFDKWTLHTAHDFFFVKKKNLKGVDLFIEAMENIPALGVASRYYELSDSDFDILIRNGFATKKLKKVVLLMKELAGDEED